MTFSTADLLLVAGVWSLALGGVSGWAVLASFQAPRVLERVGVRHPRRVLQLHLDWVIMGTVMVAVALAVPDAPGWALALVLGGAVVNPLLFAPLAFDDAWVRRRTFQVVSVLSFTALSAGLVVSAVSVTAGTLA